MWAEAEQWLIWDHAIQGLFILFFFAGVTCVFYPYLLSIWLEWCLRMEFIRIFELSFSYPSRHIKVIHNISQSSPIHTLAQYKVPPAYQEWWTLTHTPTEVQCLAQGHFDMYQPSVKCRILGHSCTEQIHVTKTFWFPSQTISTYCGSSVITVYLQVCFQFWGFQANLSFFLQSWYRGSAGS